jgi:hypothetical protein
MTGGRNVSLESANQVSLKGTNRGAPVRHDIFVEQFKLWADAAGPDPVPGI